MPTQPGSVHSMCCVWSSSCCIEGLFVLHAWDSASTVADTNGCLASSRLPPTMVSMPSDTAYAVDCCFRDIPGPLFAQDKPLILGSCCCCCFVFWALLCVLCRPTVNEPGYLYSLVNGVPTASACPNNTFSTGLLKQRSCVPCPPGYVTEANSPKDKPSECSE